MRSKFLLQSVLLFCLYVLPLLFLGWLFEKSMRTEIQNVTESANIAFTRSFVNSAWEKVSPLLNNPSNQYERAPTEQFLQLDNTVRSFVQGTDTVKVKIFNVFGITLYSSDASQIGENQASNVGLMNAVKGRVMSQTTYRGQFSSFEGQIYDRNLISSYVPVRGAGGIEAVVEIYTDRTDSMRSMETFSRNVYLGIALVLIVCFSIIQLIFYRSDRSRNNKAEEFHKLLVKQRQTEKFAKKQLAAGYGMLQQFADQLRKPLSQLQELCAEICRTPLNQQQTGIAQRLSTSLQELENQLEDLSPLTSNTPEASQPSNKPFHLAQILKSLEIRLGQKIHDKGLQLQTYLNPRADGIYLVDGPKLENTLRLCLENAASGTLAGSIQLKVQPNIKGLQFDVIYGDSQIDNNAADTSRIANGNFADQIVNDQQARQVTRTNLDLRLAAAKKLVHVMGGNFEIHQAPGHGGWIRITLPVNQRKDG